MDRDRKVESLESRTSRRRKTVVTASRMNNVLVPSTDSVLRLNSQDVELTSQLSFEYSSKTNVQCNDLEEADNCNHCNQ